GARRAPAPAARLPGGPAPSGPRTRRRRHDEGQPRVPPDRDARGARARAAGRRDAHRPHRGGGHRRRRGGAVLGPARARGHAHGTRVARGARAAGGGGLHRALERRGELMAGPAEPDVARARESEHARLPEPQAAREWLATMTLIRRFEERAGEMYARAKVGGFLHLSIGEEATIVGSARALRDTDYLVSTYRSHGHALVRGTPPETVMAELFGRVDGCSRGRGGSMHMFDGSRRFMGGYGIVGGNLPIAAGIALACDYKGSDDLTLCTFGDGASNQGTFGETL